MRFGCNTRTARRINKNLPLGEMCLDEQCVADNADVRAKTDKLDLVKFYRMEVIGKLCRAKGMKAAIIPSILLTLRQKL